MSGVDPRRDGYALRNQDLVRSLASAEMGNEIAYYADCGVAGALRKADLPQYRIAPRNAHAKADWRLHRFHDVISAEAMAAISR